MHKFRPACFECISQCQFHYNSLKHIIILAFVPTVLTPVTLMVTAVSFSFLSGSLDGVNYTIKFQFFSQTILQYIQKTSLPTTAKPAQRGPQTCSGCRR